MKILLLFLLFFMPFSASAWNKLTILSAVPGQTGHYVGHHAVNRSLMRGLSLLAVNYNFNPPTVDEIGDVVLVPANRYALDFAIGLKKSNRIKVLLAGPNMFVRSNECNSLLANGSIDCVIVPSPWVQTAYIEDAPSLEGRIAVWPAGVDTSFWIPGSDRNMQRTVIIYDKLKDEQLYNQVHTILTSHNWEPHCVRYDFYNHNDYKKLLQKTRFAVFLSRSESQGIALAECWSADVPTVVWDPQKPHYINDKKHWPISSAPYLTAATGQQWSSFDRFDELVSGDALLLSALHPRAWVLEHMSDEVCARALIDIINSYDSAISTQDHLKSTEQEIYQRIIRSVLCNFQRL